MIKRITSRRAFIAAAGMGGTALTISLLLRHGAAHDAAGSGITVVPGTPTDLAMTPLPDALAALVDTPVRIYGEGIAASGTITAVEPLALSGKRPPGVRTTPFRVRFAVDAASAPTRDAVYDVGVTIEGLSRIYLKCGDIVGGKTMLTALFA